MQFIANGIVLRNHKIQEDRRLTLLTDKAGVLDAWANGAGRPRSRLAASTELLCYSEFALFQNRGRYTVDKADSQRIFFQIRSDLDKLALASYLAEATGVLAPHEDEAGTYLRLFLNTLHLLEKDARSPALLKALYELRLLTLAGFMPDLVACRGCGAFEREGMLFFPATGDLCCPDCFDGNQAGGVPVWGGVLAAMRHIVYSEGEKLFSFNLSGDSLLLLGRICEDYLRFHVEASFPTLDFYHGIRQ